MNTRCVDFLSFLAVLLVVGAVVGPIGYAMEGSPSALWALGGAFAWVTIFALAARTRQVAVHRWALVGGWICGTAWALGWPIGRYLTDFLGTVLPPSRDLDYIAFWGVLPGLVFGIAAGIGGGLLGAIALGEKGGRYGAILGLTWGFIAGVAPYPFLVARTSLFAGLLWGLIGLVGATAGLPIGLRIGRWFRPAVLIFQDLWPYLTEMTIPFAGFVSGYLALVLLFAGLTGTVWRLDPAGSFAGFPSTVSFWDFFYFSATTATGVGGPVVATTTLAELVVSAEAIFAQGWLIAVFAAVGAHLSPRFTRIAGSKKQTE